MTTRRYGTIVKHLTDEPDTACELAANLPDDVLAHLGAAVGDEQRKRARDSGDHDALIADAFDTGFGRDGLGVNPWTTGSVIVCPGGLVAKSRANHRCRFVSVDNVWVWESAELIREEKRSLPGRDEGFKAVALLPIVEGMELDCVGARMRSGQHSLDRVVSLVVRKGELVEVSQRTVAASGMH